MLKILQARLQQYVNHEIPDVQAGFRARTLEWVAISFSNAWKWKVKVKLLSGVRLLATPWIAAKVLEWGAIAFSAIKHK